MFAVRIAAVHDSATHTGFRSCVNAVHRCRYLLAGSVHTAVCIERCMVPACFSLCLTECAVHHQHRQPALAGGCCWACQCGLGAGLVGGQSVAEGGEGQRWRHTSF